MGWPSTTWSTRRPENYARVWILKNVIANVLFIAPFFLSYGIVAARRFADRFRLKLTSTPASRHHWPAIIVVNAPSFCITGRNVNVPKTVWLLAGDTSSRGVLRKRSPLVVRSSVCSAKVGASQENADCLKQACARHAGE